MGLPKLRPLFTGIKILEPIFVVELEPLNLYVLHRTMKSSHTVLDSAMETSQSRMAISGANRLEMRTHTGNYAVGVGAAGRLQYPIQGALGQSRHVAGDDEAPFRAGCAERRYNSAQRSN